MSGNLSLTRIFRPLYLIPAVGALVLAFIWTGVLIRLSAEKADVLKAAQAKANVLAEALAQHTETTIHDIDVIALVVKREFELNPASIDLKALQDGGFFSRTTAAQVSVVDTKGRILQSTIPYAGGVYIADREHFKVHQERDIRGLYISRPVLGRVSGIWTIQLTRRLERGNGQFAGVVVVSEDRRYLTREFSNDADLGKGGAASVLLENGTRLSDGQPDGGTDEGRGGAGKTTIGHGEQIVARRPVRGYPLVVEISLSRSEALVPYARMKAVYLIASATLSAFFVIFLSAILALIHRLSKSRNRLRTLSETDTLTGLWNRHGLVARLNDMLSNQTRPNQLAVVYIDLGNLKRVNDTLGHEAGDQLLKKVATRLLDGLTPSILGRFGGDEFIAILATGDSAQDVYPATKTALNKIVSIFETPVTVRGRVFNIRASIGVSVQTRIGDGVSTLIREADEAMYSAKADMRATHETVCKFYSNQMRDKARRAVEAEQHLRAALSKHTLRFAFHPVHDLKRKSIWGLRIAAAVADDMDSLHLIRDAVSVAKENGLLAPVTEFVMLHMFIATADRENAERPDRLIYRLAIDQFLTIDCASVVHSLRSEFQVTPDALVFEVPESAFLEEPVLAEKRAAALLRAGVRLILYEFSGGFASFALLEKRLFSGVLIGQRPSATDILASVIKRLTQTGLMVILESPEPVVGLEHDTLLYTTEPFDSPLDASLVTTHPASLDENR